MTYNKNFNISRRPQAGNPATLTSQEQVAQYILTTPPVKTIDCAGNRIGNGAGWVKIEQFLKQGYRFVYDKTNQLCILHRASYTIDCGGRYTFPERVIAVFNIAKLSLDAVETFFKTYHSQADYIDSLSRKKVILSYRMVEAPYVGDGRAWRMVVTKS